MMSRLLLAVDDSVDSLAAARVAVELARAPGRVLRVVHSSSDGVVDAALDAAGARPGVEVRRGRSEAAVLARVEDRARAAGIVVETALLTGEPGHAVLDEARRWHADVVIVGKSARSASGEPYVGTVTRHVLEFCEQPVLVVPPPTPRPRHRLRG